MDINFEAKEEQNYMLFKVKGEIDLYNAKALKERVNDVMEDVDVNDLILDILNVQYIDSTGLGILIGIKRRITEKDGNMVIVLKDDRIKKLFEITGLVNIFVIADSVEAAAGKLEG